MIYKKKFSFLLCLIVAGVLTGSCQKKAVQETAGTVEHLTVITPTQRYILDEFGDAFNKYYQEKYGKTVQYEWLDLGGTSDAVKFVSSEFSKKPEGINIDIFWGGGSTPHYLFKEQGLLLPYKVPADILKHFPPNIAGVALYDPEGYWYASALSSFGFACNERLLKMKGMEAPRTWEGLGDPRLYNMFGSADPRHSGSTHTIYAVILQAYGWEKGWATIMRMAANAKQFKRHASDILSGVATGDNICGLSIDFYAMAKIAEVGRENMSFILPEGLSAINADPIAILKGAPHCQVAEEFVAFVLSKTGQSLWMLPVGEPGGPTKKPLARLGIIPSLYDDYKDRSVVTLNPFKTKGYVTFNEAEASDLWAIVNDMVGTLAVDSRTELAAVWQKMAKKGATPESLKVFDSVPINQKKAYEYAAQWKDEVFRNKVINEWQTFNRKKLAKLNELTP